MRVLHLLLIVVLVSQTGCRVFDRWDRDRPLATPASRTRNPELPRDRQPTADPRFDRNGGTWPYDRSPAQPTGRQPNNNGSWLDSPVPRSNVAVPPAGTWADPNGKNYDYRAASQTKLAGVVRTPDGRVVEDAFVALEYADPRKNTPGGSKGAQTDRGGYFEMAGLPTNESYRLTVKVNSGGRSWVAQQFVTVPNERLELVLSEELASGPGGFNFGLPGERAVPVPPANTTPLPLPNVSGSTDLPFPGENRTGPYTPVPPPNTGPARPDLVAPGPTPDFRTASPPVAIPGFGTLPAPRMNEPGSTSRSVEPKFEFALDDTSGKAKTFPSGREGDLVLLSFVSSTCKHSVRSASTLRDLHDQFRDEALTVVGIVCDEGTERECRRAADVFRADQRLPFEVYLEQTPGKIQDSFRVEGYPTLVLIDGSGRKLWQGHPKNVDELRRTIRDFIDSRK